MLFSPLIVEPTGSYGPRDNVVKAPWQLISAHAHHVPQTKDVADATNVSFTTICSELFVTRVHEAIDEFGHQGPGSLRSSETRQVETAVDIFDRSDRRL